MPSAQDKLVSILQAAAAVVAPEAAFLYGQEAARRPENTRHDAVQIEAFSFVQREAQNPSLLIADLGLSFGRPRLTDAESEPTHSQLADEEKAVQQMRGLARQYVRALEDQRGEDGKAGVEVDEATIRYRPFYGTSAAVLMGCIVEVTITAAGLLTYCD